MLLLAPILLIALVVIPKRSANLSPETLASLISLMLLFVFGDIILLSAIAAMQDVGWLADSWVPSRFMAALMSKPGLLVDGLAGTMAMLISFVGWTIVQYSTRYLSGEATQGRFMKWLGFTLGSVLLLVLAGNLILLAAAWALTSLGLHKLLTHYSDRTAGQLAARKKFIYSRLGDVFIVLAIVMIYNAYGALQYTELFERVASANSVPVWQVSSIGILLALGAMTKSAQFPLHTWLPDTMETPTPVSALMHAGIINGGGFLLIRLNPLISSSTIALTLLTAVGGITAILGAVVMLCQTSAKRKLAYSTIAQMGFMTLQCGLGAFSAALLHIVAHSLYKAHAFLSAGGVAKGIARPSSPLPRLRIAEPTPSWFSLVARATVASGLAAGLVLSGIWLFGLTEKLGGPMLLLPLALALAIAHFLATAFGSKSSAIWARTAALSALACAAYMLALVVFGGLLGTTSVPPVTTTHSAVAVALGIAFVLTSVAYGLLPVIDRSGGLNTLRVHASSGFYVDILMSRITRRFVPAIVEHTVAHSVTDTPFKLENTRA